MLEEFRTQDIIWDKANRSIFEPIQASEGDEHGRRLKVQIINGGVIENLSGTNLYLAWQTSNKSHSGLEPFDVLDAAQGTFELYYPTGMLKHSGKLRGGLVLTDANGRLMSREFTIQVDRSVVDDDAIESSNEFSALTQALIKINDLEDNYAPRLNEVTRQLAHKVTHGENESITKSMLSQEIKEEINNGEIEFKLNTSEIEDGAISNPKISPGAITHDKIAKLEHQSLDRDDIETGYFINDSGEIIANPNFSISGHIPVVPGRDYEVYGGDTESGISNFVGTFYDQDEVFLGYFGSRDGANNMLLMTEIQQVITIPSGVSTLRLTLTNNKSDFWLFESIESKGPIDWLLVENKNIKDKTITLEKLSEELMGKLEYDTSWSGKTANFLGDSITFGSGLSNTEDRFTNLISQALNMQCRNYGVSGSKIGRVANETTSFTQRFRNMDNSADIVFVFGGTNDYGHTQSNAQGTVPFGDFEDRTENTFYGALHVLYRGLIEKYPGTEIIIITPMHRTAPQGSSGNDYVPNADTNKNLKQYVQAILEVAEYYGLKVINLFKDLNMNPNISSVRQMYVPDGLHPNSLGHLKLSEEIIRFITGNAERVRDHRFISMTQEEYDDLAVKDPNVVYLVGDL